MRILHITNHVNKIGNGIVNVAVDLACLQAKDGHEVAFASAGGEFEILLTKYGVKHFELNQSRKLWNTIKAAWCYRRVIQKFKPDIVHVHMMTGVVLAWTLRFGLNYGLVATVHNEFQRSSILMGLGDSVIAVSHAVYKSMIKRGIPKYKMRVVINGTLGTPRRHELKEYEPLLLNHPTIVTVSGMYRRKGIGELIDAFAKVAQEYPNANLYLVGDGPDRESLEAQAHSTGFAERIHFTGFQNEPQRYLLSADIFVLASHYEAFGLALTEAREAGCAIVASNVGGIPEALDGGQAGILVPVKDSHTLADTLQELLGDEDRLRFWKEQASQNLENLTVSRVHLETLAVYRELVIRPFVGEWGVGSRAWGVGSGE